MVSGYVVNNDLKADVTTKYALRQTTSGGVDLHGFGDDPITISISNENVASFNTTSFNCNDISCNDLTCSDISCNDLTCATILTGTLSVTGTTTLAGALVVGDVANTTAWKLDDKATGVAMLHNASVTAPTTDYALAQADDGTTYVNAMSGRKVHFCIDDVIRAYIDGSKLRCEGNLEVVGTTSLTGGASITGDSTVTGDLEVTGSTTFTGGVTGNMVVTGGSVNAAQHVTAGTGLAVTTGGANITGNSTVTGDIGVTGTVSGASVTAGSSTVKLVMGSRDADFVGIRHSGTGGWSNDYALVQKANGVTYVNATSGQSIHFRINDYPVATVDAGGLWLVLSPTAGAHATHKDYVDDAIAAAVSSTANLVVNSVTAGTGLAVTTGGANITGNSTVTGDLGVTGTVSGASVTAGSSTAKFRLGTYSATLAGLWNNSYGSSPGNNYTLLQDTDGTTHLNAKSTKSINFRSNNSTIASVYSSGMKVHGKTLTVDFTPGSGTPILCKRHISHIARQIEFANPYGPVGSIKTNGWNTSYNTSSDYRVKENVLPLTGAIARVQQLKPKRFSFIGDDDTAFDGFLAHEAASVVPEAVSGDKDEVDEDGMPVYQGIDHSKMVALLTGALQEAIGRIEALEARLP